MNYKERLVARFKVKLENVTKALPNTEQGRQMLDLMTHVYTDTIKTVEEEPLTDEERLAFALESISKEVFKEN